MHLINDPSLVTRPARVVGAPRPGEARMQMLYGVNQADQCWDFAVGPHASARGAAARDRYADDPALPVRQGRHPIR